MIERTGKPSKKLMLQHQVKEALNQSTTMSEFINNLEKQSINVLFNQASTGRVSGITYLVPGFKIRGQALGNQFKFGSIAKQLNYEQNRGHQSINQANSRTRKKFGTSDQAIPAIRFPKTGVPFSKEWCHFAKSSGIKGLPEIPFGIVDPSQRRNLRVGQRAKSDEKITKETSGHMDTDISYHRHPSFNILGGLVGLLDGTMNNEPEKRNKQKEEKKKRGLSM